jgi:hypothetical protein
MAKQYWRNAELDPPKQLRMENNGISNILLCGLFNIRRSSYCWYYSLSKFIMKKKTKKEILKSLRVGKRLITKAPKVEIPKNVYNRKKYDPSKETA